MIDNRIIRTRNSDESFLQHHWRPMMAWSYGIVCLWDFMFATIFFAWYAHYTGTPYVAWIPLTTSGGGLYHLSMGAIIGVSSFGRTQEKVSANNIQAKFDSAPTVKPAVKPAVSADPEQ